MKLLCGDALTILKTLPDESVQCCVTSPPYWGLRDYGVPGQLGLEKTPEEYVQQLVSVFREVKRVLRKDGTLWLNLGDSYAGGGNYRGVNPETLTKKQGSNRASHGLSQRCGIVDIPLGLKPKDLVGIPWRVAFALQADGWYLRQDIIWSKPNPMPESVRDRCTKAHEYVFLLSKSEQYCYDAEAIREPATDTGRINGRDGRIEDERARPPQSNPRTLKRLDYSMRGRNLRSVWTITTKPFKEAHFATFPPEIPTICIKAGCPIGAVVLDPFCGSGTTGMVAKELGREFIGIELNPEYVKMAEKRIGNFLPLGE